MTLRDSYEPFEELLFSRGFLIWRTGSAPDVVKRLSWRLTRVREWRIAHAPDLEVAVRDTGPVAVALMGWASSVERDSVSLVDVARWIEAVADDPEAYQERVDELVGRFLVLRADRGTLRVQQDALGLRGAFFNDHGERVLGSHAELVGEITGAGPSAWSSSTYTKETNIRSAPGRQTVRRGVFALTPNTELELYSGQTCRIFPRRARLESTDIAEVMHSIRRTAEKHIELLIKSERPLAISLSAGFDTRLTLALSRKYVNDIQWFTYDLPFKARTKADEHDAEAGAALAEQFSLPHTTLRIEDPSVPPGFARVMAVNRFRAHSLALAHAYRSLFAPDAIHLRSSGYGVVKSFYRTSGFPDAPVTAEYRTHLASWGKCQDATVIDAFDEQSRATNFSKISQLGYDELDFHLWEYREGVWLQNTLAESDVSSETGILLGSRSMISRMLSLPLEVRASQKHFLWLIRECWPDLLGIPINGEIYAAAEVDSMEWSPGSTVRLPFTDPQLPVKRND